MKIRVKIDAGKRYRLWIRYKLFGLNFWGKILDTEKKDEFFNRLKEYY